MKKARGSRMTKAFYLRDSLSTKTTLEQRAEWSDEVSIWRSEGRTFQAGETAGENLWIRNKLDLFEKWQEYHCVWSTGSQEESEVVGLDCTSWAMVRPSAFMPLIWWGFIGRCWTRWRQDLRLVLKGQLWLSSGEDSGKGQLLKQDQQESYFTVSG